MKPQTSRANKMARRMAVYQQVFNSPEGQEVLYDMMQVHHILSSTFDGQDRLKALFREGERNVVLRILKILKVDVKLMHERIKLHEDE